MKRIDRKSVLARARLETKRIRANFNFTEEVYKPFVERCEKDGVTVTRVLEELMKEYIKS
jgi:hypothetical protein